MITPEATSRGGEGVAFVGRGRWEVGGGCLVRGAQDGALEIQGVRLANPPNKKVDPGKFVICGYLQGLFLLAWSQFPLAVRTGSEASLWSIPFGDIPTQIYIPALGITSILWHDKNRKRQTLPAFTFTTRQQHMSQMENQDNQVMIL